MKTALRKTLSLALALCMLCSFGILGASAAAPYEDGTYTATARAMNAGDLPDMLDVYLDHDADVTVSDGQAVIRLYFIYPVPECTPDECQGGTITDMVMTVAGKQYRPASDITTQPLRTMDAESPMFPLDLSTPVPTQVLTLTIPLEDLDSMASGAPISCRINHAALPDRTSKIRIELTDLKLVQPAPDESSSHSLQLTAQVASSAPSYEVEIPETLALGTLSRDTDTQVSYTVNVTAKDLMGGRVTVSAPLSGQLTSGSDSLPYRNSFGSQTASGSARLSGEFTVAAEDVKAAAAGNYTGTALFHIAFQAAD